MKKQSQLLEESEIAFEKSYVDMVKSGKRLIILLRVFFAISIVAGFCWLFYPWSKPWGGILISITLGGAMPMFWGYVKQIERELKEEEVDMVRSRQIMQDIITRVKDLEKSEGKEAK